jgi:hypothetical protein
MDTIRREYRLKRWVQIWYSALGALFIVIGAHIISITKADVRWDSFKSWGNYLMPVAFVVLGCYFIATALRSRVVLQGSCITVRYAIREKSADLGEIMGYQTYAIKKLWSRILYKNISFWYLRLKGSEDYISIMQLFDVDNYFHSWLQQLPDLDRGSLNL